MPESTDANLLFCEAKSEFAFEPKAVWELAHKRLGEKSSFVACTASNKGIPHSLFNKSPLSSPETHFCEASVSSHLSLKPTGARSRSARRKILAFARKAKANTSLSQNLVFTNINLLFCEASVSSQPRRKPSGSLLTSGLPGKN